MNIAFCFNRQILKGLGASLSSVVRNCTDSKSLKFWFLCAGLTEKDKEQIRILLAAEKFRGGYVFLEFDPMDYFGSFSTLHGDRTTYGRLLLADLVDAEVVLYLDADLVVEVNVLELENFDFKGQILAAVGGGTFKYALGSQFYKEETGLSPDLEYFNAGILLLNLKEWRLQKVREKCLQIAAKYDEQLPSHDQSMLNILCAGVFAKLPSNYNCAWYPDRSKPEVAEKMILHFVGSPKPWDIFGFFIHGGYQTWKKYLNDGWSSSFNRVTFDDVIRAWNIRRSYVRNLRSKMSRQQKCL
jgi:lipopolysaccharide biosynthesis glycosyltransferase